MKRVFVILIALLGLFATIPIRAYAAPDIEIWPSYGGDFEVFNVEGGFGPSDTRKVWIKNVGTSDLTITAISSPGAPYSLVSPPVTPFTITPGAERDINILFSPTTQNTYNSKVTISSNDADESNLDIPLKGRADEDPVTISPGDFFTGEIKVIGDTDGFHFYGKKDDAVSITTGKQKDYSGTFYPRWELYAPDGSLLKSITGGGSAIATLPATGAYTIVIGDGEGNNGYGFNNQTGQYGLSIQGISTLLVSGQRIVTGQNLSDEIEAHGDTDAFCFNAVQGDTVSITTGKQKDYSGTFYPRWELYAPDGSLLKSITGGGSATATLPATGAYTIVIGDGEGNNGYGFNNQTGQYGLSLQCITCTKLRYEEDDPAINYTGPWDFLYDSRCSGGALKYSRQKGAKASFAFKGTGIRWIFSKDKNFGKAKVYLDGKYTGLVDLYQSATQYQQVLEKTGLPSGEHTIALEVSGRKSKKSKGIAIDLDAFEIIP